MEIKQIKINKIKPNNYNPNKMTEERYKELIEEIKYLGRIPKPIILDTDYTIIDGEHTYKASKELKLKEIPCEIVEADEFEKRRLTYKYNQHGEHDKVLLGAMFKQMLDMENISQRELAKRIDISEGTVRNALLFFDIQNEVRNDYAVNDFTVEQIRMYEYFKKEVNPIFAKAWLKVGGKRQDLIKCVEYAFKKLKIKESAEHVISRGEKLQELVKEFLTLDKICWQGIREEQAFSTIYPEVLDRHFFMRKIMKEIFPYWHRGYKDIKDYFPLYFERVWPFSSEYWFTETLKFLLTKNSKFLLSPEELKEITKEAEDYTRSGDKKSITWDDFKTGFLARKLKSKYGSFKKEDFLKIEKEIYKSKLEEAPDYIKEADYKYYSGEEDVKAKYELWKMNLYDDVKKIVAKEGVKPGDRNWEKKVAVIERELRKSQILKEFNHLTPEQTAEETTKYLKDLCSQFKLTEEEKDFLNNEFEKWITEFLKGCKVGEYLSYVFYIISKDENRGANLRRELSRIDTTMRTGGAF